MPPLTQEQIAKNKEKIKEMTEKIKSVVPTYNLTDAQIEAMASDQKRWDLHERCKAEHEKQKKQNEISNSYTGYKHISPAYSRSIYTYLTVGDAPEIQEENKQFLFSIAQEGELGAEAQKRFAANLINEMLQLDIKSLVKKNPIENLESFLENPGGYYRAFEFENISQNLYKEYQVPENIKAEIKARMVALQTLNIAGSYMTFYSNESSMYIDESQLDATQTTMFAMTSSSDMQKIMSELSTAKLDEGKEISLPGASELSLKAEDLIIENKDLNKSGELERMVNELSDKKMMYAKPFSDSNEPNDPEFDAFLENLHDLQNEIKVAIDNPENASVNRITELVESTWEKSANFEKKWKEIGADAAAKGNSITTAQSERVSFATSAKNIIQNEFHFERNAQKDKVAEMIHQAILRKQDQYVRDGKATPEATEIYKFITGGGNNINMFVAGAALLPKEIFKPLEKDLMELSQMGNATTPLDIAQKLAPYKTELMQNIGKVNDVKLEPDLLAKGRELNKKLAEQHPDKALSELELRTRLRDKTLLNRHERAKTLFNDWNKRKEIAKKYEHKNGPAFLNRVILSYINTDGTPEANEYNDKLYDRLCDETEAGLKARKEIAMDFINEMLSMDTTPFIGVKTPEELMDVFEANPGQMLRAYDVLNTIIEIKRVYDIPQNILDELGKRQVQITDASRATSTVSYLADENSLCLPLENLSAFEMTLLQGSDALGKDMNKFLSLASSHLADEAKHTDEEEALPTTDLRISLNDIQSPASKLKRHYMLNSFVESNKYMGRIADELKEVNVKYKNSAFENLMKAAKGYTNLLDMAKNDPYKVTFEDIQKGRAALGKFCEKAKAVNLDNVPNEYASKARSLYNTVSTGAKAINDEFHNAKLQEGISQARARKNEEFRKTLTPEKQRLFDQLKSPEGFAELQESIKTIATDIKSTDEMFVWTNTKKFNKMRDSLYELNTMMKDMASGKSLKNPIELFGKFEEMGGLANEYMKAKTQSVKEARSTGATTSTRAMHRLSCAISLNNLMNGEKALPSWPNRKVESLGMVARDIMQRTEMIKNGENIAHDNNALYAAETLMNTVIDHLNAEKNGFERAGVNSEDLTNTAKDIQSMDARFKAEPHQNLERGENPVDRQVNERNAVEM